MAKLSVNEYVDVVRRSGLVEAPKLDKLLAGLPNNGSSDPAEVAQKLIEAKLITPWQNDKLMQGKHSGFVLGKYRLLSHISSGGMSSVYLAEHVLMQRRVAVKVLPPARLDDSSFRERFHLECQVMAALDHPNIVRAHDFDVDGKLHYLVMEYIDGPDLEGVVRKSGPLSFELAANYTRQASDGLGHAHDAGLIHRDMKPANLLVDSRGCIKVLDLGVARITGANDSTSLTLAHKEDVVGTADFLAPEQAINSHNVDFRADIYALGGTFYYMLTGHGPFPDGTMAQKLLAHQTQEPAPVTKDRPDCPPGLVTILTRMMAKKLKARYQTMSEVSDDLGRWLADPSFVPSKPSKAAPAPKPKVEEPLALEERGESVDFPLGDLTNVRPSAAAAAAGPPAPSEDSEGGGGYGLVDLDDSVDADQAELGIEQAPIDEVPPPAEQDEDSSQEVMATKQTAQKKGDGFWDDVLNQIDEPAKERKPLEPGKSEPPKPVPMNKAEAKSEPAKPAGKEEAKKPFSPTASALVPAGKRDLTTRGDDKKDKEKSPAGKSVDKVDKAKVEAKGADKPSDSKSGKPKPKKIVLDTCPACGANLKEGSPICGECGFNTVTGAKSDGPMKPMARPKMDDDEPDRPNLLKNKYVLGGIGLVAILLVAGALTMLSGPDSGVVLPGGPVPPGPGPVPPGPGPGPGPGPVKPIPKKIDPVDPGPGKQVIPKKQDDPPRANPGGPWKPPASLDKWVYEDFYNGAALGEPQLLAALTLLLDARKGEPEIEEMIIRMLEPSKLVSAPAGQSPPPAIPLNEKVVNLIVDTLQRSNSAEAKQALLNIVDGQYNVSNDDAYVSAALTSMMARPKPEWNQLLAECYFTPEKHRSPQNAKGINADGLRKKVLELFPKANVALRTEFGKRAADRSLPPATIAEVVGLLSQQHPGNVPAQVELFMNPKITPQQDEIFQNYFILYGQTAMDVLIAGKPLSDGSPAVSVDEAQAICAALWQERVSKAVWDRFRAITDATKEKEQRTLLRLSATLPINSTRVEMAGLVSRFWKNLDPTAWTEASADFGSTWSDPALWIVVKTGPDRIPLPSRTAPRKIENKWYEASRQYLRVLNQRFHRAAESKPINPELEAKRPIKVHDGAKVVAEIRIEWPEGLEGKLPGAGPLVVHYLRIEERGRLEDLDRLHYAKAIVPLPKRRVTQNAPGVEESRWLDSTRELDGKTQTLDVLFTRTRPSGAPSADEELVIEILMMETPK